MDPKQERAIEYLLTRKFPYHRAIRATLARTPSLATARTPAGFERQKSLSAAAAYKVELRAMSPEGLAVAVDRDRAEDEDRERFFNQPHSLADLQYWAKAAYWNLEEATALSFGKEPGVVNSKSIEPLVGIYSFAADYARVRDLVERAKVMGQIDDPVIPRDFIAWAKRSGINYPPDLEAELVAQGQQIGDWKTAYDELKAQFDELAPQAAEASGFKARAAEADKVIANLLQERDGLLIQVQELQKKKPFGERERQSLLKMVIGMAAKKYGYNPHANRSKVAKNIVSDMSP